MKKCPLLLLALVTLVPSFIFANPREIFTIGDAAKISLLFKNKEGESPFLFSPADKEKLLPPKIIARKTNPVIPREKRTPPSKTNDIVKLGLVVSDNGKVIAAAVASSTDSGFNAAAIAGVQGWEFSPALVEGKPVAFYIEIPLNFVVPKFTWN